MVNSEVHKLINYVLHVRANQNIVKNIQTMSDFDIVVHKANLLLKLANSFIK